MYNSAEPQSCAGEDLEAQGHGPSFLEAGPEMGIGEGMQGGEGEETQHKCGWGLPADSQHQLPSLSGVTGDAPVPGSLCD